MGTTSHIEWFTQCINSACLILNNETSRSLCRLTLTSNHFEYLILYLVIMCWVQRSCKLCISSGCRKGIITPDSTHNFCLTFKVFDTSTLLSHNHVSCSMFTTGNLVVCINLQDPWAHEWGVNHDAQGCQNFCPTVQFCCIYHTVWFCLCVLILHKLCYVCTVKINFRNV